MKETGEPRTWHLSVVLTSTRDGTEVFDTLDDMPTVLRAQCVRALDSKESQTVVIADEAGREYLRRIVEERESAVKAEAPAPPKPGRVYSLRLAAEIAVCGAIGLTLWLLATLR
ncbi:hypothetical protein [uncultured Paludibaculum sp.]|uniref:hypothetical protein n=1 Tax=uncultured Paludibaculum sp. TaxID=1765020 RepID=UPI002AAAE442|nr:hypothetical protein [uncultured Paludibaculum sp.]